MPDPSAASDARSAASVDHSATLRTYAEQLPVVLSVPVLAAALRDAADEIDRLRREIDSLRPHVEGIGYAG